MPQLRDNRGVTPRHAPKVPSVMSSAPGSCAFGRLLSCSREARGAAGTRWTNAPLSWKHPLQTQQDCFPPAAPLPSALHAAGCTGFVSSCPPGRHTRGEVSGSAQGAEDKDLPLCSSTASGEFFPSRKLRQRGKAAKQLPEISALDGQDHCHKGLKRKT